MLGWFIAGAIIGSVFSSNDNRNSSTQRIVVNYNVVNRTKNITNVNNVRVVNYTRSRRVNNYNIKSSRTSHNQYITREMQYRPVNYLHDSSYKYRDYY